MVIFPKLFHHEDTVDAPRRW